MEPINEKIFCPLCGNEKFDLFFEDKKREYFRCFYCKLVFVPKRHWLTSAEEKSRYDLHENINDDDGYRKFLSRLSTPLLKKIKRNQKGLDFGCGPGPTLSVMLKEQGQQVDIYDPFYFNNSSVFEKNYDYICATEVVEHLCKPDKEFTTLFKMLNQGGWLALMTKLVIDKNSFSKWHYIRDMTHICFYSHDTFEYLAKRFNAELNFESQDVIFLQKKSTILSAWKSGLNYNKKKDFKNAKN